MPRIYQKSISKDLIAGLVSIVSLVVGCLIALNYYYLSKENIKHFEKRTNEYLSYLKETLSVPLWNYDHDSIRKIAESMIRNEIIDGMRIMDADMKESLFHMLDTKHRMEDIKIGKTSILYNGNVVGNVELYYSSTDLKRVNRKIIWSGLVNLGATLIVLSFVTGLMLRLILGKSLNQLMLAIDRIAAGEYDYDCQKGLSHYSEIENILSKFNLMSGKIKKRENDLVTTSNRLSSILNNTTGLVYLKDMDGRYLFINQRFERLFQIKNEYVTGLSDKDIFPEEVAAILTANDRVAYAEDGPVEFEEIIRQNNEDRTYISVKFPIKDFMDRTYAICGISTDITQRKLAEKEVIRLNEELEARVDERTKDLLKTNEMLKFEMAERQKSDLALRSNETLLRSTLESTADGILVVSNRGVITHFNERFRQIWNICDKDILNMDVLTIREYILRQIEDPDRFLEKTESLYKKNSQEIELISFKDGRIMERFSCPLISHGENLGRVWSYRDVTVQKKSEVALAAAKESAEASSQSKSMFLATMSHEIRTPMNGVIGMAGLLASTQLDSEQREYLNTIQSSAESLLTIINDILDFSKIEAGKLDLELFDFDLYRVMDEVGDILAIKAHEKKLAFGCLIHSSVPRFLEGDPGRLRQIVINLSSNAIKFTHKGEIGIHLSVEKEMDSKVLIKFKVSDTGIGIPDERKSRLFKPFSQIDASTTREYGGTGLGLAISKRLTGLMGGEIGVESTEGKGTTFWFTVPFRKQTGVNDMIPVADDALKGKRVLTVDDNFINQEIVLAYLAQWGCQAQAAGDAAEGLKMLHKASNSDNAYDLVLIDRMMPDIDGEELAIAIKSNPKFRTIKMIMLTSSGLSGESKRAKEIGFHGYLTKPIKKDHLKKCVCLVFGVQKDDLEDEGAKEMITYHHVANGSGMRILLVEDNVTNQKVAQHILKKYGYYSDVVCNGREAVTSFENIPYDLILMDVQMPVMDGLEASKRIRAIESYRKKDKNDKRRIPIIALTANAMRGDRESCLSAGMDDYLSKPINPDELLEKLVHWSPDKSAFSLKSDSMVIVNDDTKGKDSEIPPINMTDALARSMGDKKFLKSIVDEFLDKKDEKIISFHAALELSDMKQIEDLAHTLKGVSGNIGAYDLSNIASKLYMSGKNENMDGLNEIVEALEKEYDRIHEFVKKFDWS